MSSPFIANKSHDQSLLLPDCVSVMTLEGEESGSCSLQDDVTRLYYMLAVGCRSAASKESAAIRAVVVVLEDGSDGFCAFAGIVPAVFSGVDSRIFPSR